MSPRSSLKEEFCPVPCFPIAWQAALTKISRCMKIAGFELYRIDLRTRLPFQYGIATMTRVPEIFVRLQVQFDPPPAAGFSSDCLPPK